MRVNSPNALLMICCVIAVARADEPQQLLNKDQPAHGPLPPGVIALWQTSEANSQPTIPFITPNGEYIAWTDGSGAVSVWNWRKSTKPDLLGRRQKGFRAHAMSWSNNHFATSGYDSKVCIWDLKNKSLLFELASQYRFTYSLAFSPDGKYLVGGGEDSSLCMWNIETGERIWKYDRLQTPAITPGIVHVCFSSDGKQVLGVGQGVEASVHRSDTGLLVKRWRACVKQAYQITETPDRRHIITFDGGEGTLGFWDPESFELVRKVATGQDERIMSFNVTSDSRLTYCRTYNGPIHVLELASGRDRFTFLRKSFEATWADITKDGKYLVTRTRDAAIVVWDVERIQEEAAPITVEEADAVWVKLASDDAADAGIAMRRLIATPKLSVEVLRKQLLPFCIDQRSVKELISDLSDSNFQTRSQAAARILNNERAALAAFQNAAKESPELKRRADELCPKLKAGLFEGAALQAIRAIEVLERVGSREAIEVLEAVAKGPANTRTTADAIASLKRLRGGRPSP